VSNLLGAQSLDEKDLARLLGQMRKERVGHRTLEVLRWAQKQTDININEFHYSACIRSLGETGDEQSIVALLAEMQEKHIARSERVYGSLMYAFGHLKKWTRSLELLAEMKAEGIQPSELTYVTLIKCCAQSGKYDAALDLAVEMDTDGVPQSELTCGALLAVCQKMGDVDRAMHYLTQLKGTGGRMTADIYNTALEVLADFGGCDHAVRLLAEMRSGDLRLSARTFNAIITAHVAAGQPWEVAMEWVETMRSEGIQVNAFTYTTVCRAAARSGDVETMRAALQAAKWHPLDLMAYTSLVKACADTGWWGEGEGLMEAMKEGGVRPDVVTYTALIAAYAKDNNFAAADQVWEEMVAAGVKPNVVTFSEHIEALAKGGFVRDATQKLKQMERTGRKPSAQVCLTVIKACALDNRWPPTRPLLALLQKANGGAHATLVSTLDCAINARNVKAVLATEIDTSGAVV